MMTSELKERIREEILEPTLKGFKKDGLDFHGVLFIGLMLEKDGPKVIEFNNRFGDPETQSVLMRLDSDLLEIFTAVCNDSLGEMDIKWKDDSAGDKKKMPSVFRHLFLRFFADIQPGLHSI